MSKGRKREGASEARVPDPDRCFTLVLISSGDCVPCRTVKEFLPHIAANAGGSLRLDMRHLTTQEFIEESSNGRLAVSAVPALLLYRGAELIGRVVGWKGKHGVMSEPFVQQWLERKGVEFAGRARFVPDS